MLGHKSCAESLTDLGTKDGLFKDKDLCFGCKSWAEGLANLCTKDGLFKDKDLCFPLVRSRGQKAGV